MATRSPPSHAIRVTGVPVNDNVTFQTIGPRAPAVLEDIRLLELRAHLQREAKPHETLKARGDI